MHSKSSGAGHHAPQPRCAFQHIFHNLWTGFMVELSWQLLIYIFLPNHLLMWMLQFQYTKKYTIITHILVYVLGFFFSSFIIFLFWRKGYRYITLMFYLALSNTQVTEITSRLLQRPCFLLQICVEKKNLTTEYPDNKIFTKL